MWFWRPNHDEPFHTVKGLAHIRELDLHPDNQHLLAAAFQQRGSGGNGRSRAARTEYQDNVGAVKVFAMAERKGVRR